MPAQTHLFPCLSDNFGALVHDPDSGATAAIDAPEAGAVEAALKVTGWRLTDILVTHHHADHTAGIPDLKQRRACRVVAPAAEASGIPAIDETVREGDTVAVGGLKARVLETPGHTAGHVSYWFEAECLVFAGDTLFSIGCGRVIEGTPPMMWESLKKLRALPGQTRVFCGHEYTQSNIRFAQTIEPDNTALIARAAEVAEQIAHRQPTIPTTIDAERAANPFLRADLPDLAAAVGMPGRPPAEVFAEIRARKNKF